MVMPALARLCPQPPDCHLDWGAILLACPWLQPLASTPQDPIHHAEGDVLTHTGMVVAELCALAGWRALPPERRLVLFAAALLHDIAKPQCTVEDADGRVHSPGHARQGAGVARRLLWETDTPARTREQIVALVRLHALPLWLIERDDAERQASAASWRCQMDELALLAEADMRGRICADREDLLLRIELFRAYCAELGCLSGPRPFPADTTRVRYFRQTQASPHYHAYDDSWGDVRVLAGLPGAGKDTWIAANASDVPVVSLDAIRQRRGIDPTGDQGAVVAEAKEQARVLLRQRVPFIWNATNLSRMLRDPLIDMVLNYGARANLVYCEAPRTTLIQRNRERSAPVPAAVIERLVGRLDWPDLTEAHRLTFSVQ